MAKLINKDFILKAIIIKIYNISIYKLYNTNITITSIVFVVTSIINIALIALMGFFQALFIFVLIYQFLNIYSLNSI